MKTAFTLAATLVAIVSAPTAFAEDEVEGEGRSFGNGHLPEFLIPFDVNENGVLSAEERQAARDARKDRRAERRAIIDANGDGEITDDELVAARSAALAKIEEKRNQRFEEADTDDDGFISPEEFAAIPAVAAMIKNRPLRARHVFDRLDSNDDSLISLEEFLAHLSEKRDRKADRDPPRVVPEIPTRPEVSNPPEIPTRR